MENPCSPAVSTAETIIQTHTLGFLLIVGPSCVWDVSFHQWKVQTTDCLIAWALRTGNLGVHLPFTGDANCHHQCISLLFFMRPLGTFSSSLNPHFLPSVAIYHLFKLLSCFSFPLCLYTGWFSLSPCRQVLPTLVVGKDALASTE